MNTKLFGAVIVLSLMACSDSGSGGAGGTAAGGSGGTNTGGFGGANTGGSGGANPGGSGGANTGGSGGANTGGSGGTNEAGSGGANTGGSGGANTGGSGGANEAGAGGANTGGAGGTNTGGSGGAGGQDSVADCTDACNTVYDCGVEGDNCPGFSGDPAQKALYVGTVGSGGCIDICLQNLVLLAIVDPNNCQGTIATLSGVSAQFAAVCANGL